MDYSRFYKALFEPLVSMFGPLDRDTICAVVGFNAGGPLNFCSRGRGTDEFILYVSCELAVRADQIPSSFGRFELLTFCDDEPWARRVLTDLGEMSLEMHLDDRHTVDVSARAEEGCPVQGLILEELYSTEIDGERFGVMLVLGVSREELERARESGASEVVRTLKKQGRYPNTCLREA